MEAEPSIRANLLVRPWVSGDEAGSGGGGSEVRGQQPGHLWVEIASRISAEEDASQLRQSSPQHEGDANQQNEDEGSRQQPADALCFVLALV